MPRRKRPRTTAENPQRRQLRPAGVGDAVRRCEIRLDVEQRRAVAAVDVANGEPRAVDGQQLHDGKPDRVRPQWRAQAEHTARGIEMARRLAHDIATRFVQPVEQDQVREPLDALEAGGIARVELDARLDVAFARILRAVGQGRERRADRPMKCTPASGVAGRSMAISPGRSFGCSCSFATRREAEPSGDAQDGDAQGQLSVVIKCRVPAGHCGPRGRQP